MDTQTKLIFTIYVYGTTNEVVNTIVTEKIIDLTKYPDGNLGDKLIHFGEYEAVTVTLESADESAELIVETFEEDIKSVKNGETVNLTSRIDEEGLLVPGFYMILLKTKDINFNGYYRINPSSLSWQGLENIKIYLEKLVKGLTYNLNSERIISKGNIINLGDKYEKLNNFSCILNSIINNPIEDMKKEYIRTSVTKHMNSKVQYLINKKGASDYNGIVKENFSSISKLSVDNLENKWLKKILMQYLIYLKNIENELKLYSSNIYINEINYIVNLRGVISYHLRCSWLSDIKLYKNITKPSLRMLKDRRYYKLYEIYNKISNKGLCENEQKEEVYSFKKTSKLFEYYIFMLIINIIKDFGYEWKSGWLADQKGENLNTDLQSGTILRFESKSNIIEIAYDEEIKEIDFKNPASGFVPLNTRHKRPDVRIALFDKNYYFKNAIIVEVKCRKQKYLFNSEGETEIMKQLKDYKALGYYELKDGNGEVIWNAINNVIITYPKQFNEREKYSHPIYKFSFIDIEPSENEEDILGYDELKREMQKLLF